MWQSEQWVAIEPLERPCFNKLHFHVVCWIVLILICCAVLAYVIANYYDHLYYEVMLAFFDEEDLVTLLRLSILYLREDVESYEQT
ncbi:hypothetical protein M514_05980 [Trichuris suis]|uniref:Uncharacterized protein n=1 Tax=Trichuris suis TaxID=68888 RepID=A0A085MST5_9BILA|nr:hypothetical protein M513_05980 [Trichuris suis]KFD60281.1 hypothetical protein M514_05980 [Trichuris suis]KHJ43717.1 hypothetical protein D918_06222 [Trichuris suis]